MRKTRMLMVGIAACAMLIVDASDSSIWSSSSSGGGGYRSSGSSSSSWGRSTTSTPSYSAPRSSTTPSRPPTSSGGYSAPKSSAPKASSGSYTAPSPRGQATPGASSPKPAAKAPTARPIDLAVAAKQSSDSLAKMRSEQTKFTRPPVSGGAVGASPIAGGYQSTGKSTSMYYENRNSYYATRSYSPPVYVYQGSPSYGSWDAIFLWSMLDSRDRSFAYHHANDPGYLAWRREADRLAADNTSLRDRLAALDAEVKSQTGERNPKYLPKGVPPEVALSVDVVTGYRTPALTFATGVPESTYAAVCAGRDESNIVGFRKRAASVMDVTCIETSGSRDNVLGFMAGKYQAIIAQADAIDWAGRQMAKNGSKAKFGKRQLTAYSESMWLLVNKKSGINRIADLKRGVHTVYVGPKGSGGEVSFENLAHHASESRWLIFSGHSDQFEKVNVRSTDYLTAIRAAADDPNAVVIVMMGSSSSFMERIDREFGDRLKLVPFSGDDSLLSVRDQDNNRVYHRCVVSLRNLPRLHPSPSTRTLCVQAVVVVSDSWVKRYGEPADHVFRGNWGAMQPDLRAIASGVVN